MVYFPRCRRVKRAESTVCYSDVGCFEDAGYLDMVPSRPEDVATRFLLYSSRHSRSSDIPLIDVPFLNMTGAYQWAGKAFNMSAPTKVTKCASLEWLGLMYIVYRLVIDNKIGRSRSR